MLPDNFISTSLTCMSAVWLTPWNVQPKEETEHNLPGLRMTLSISTVNQKEIMNQLKRNSWVGSSSYQPLRMDFTGSFGHSNLIQKLWKNSIYNNNFKFKLITLFDTNFLLHQVAFDDSVHMSFFSILGIWLRHFFLFKEELQGARYHTMLKGYFILCLWPR